MIGLIRIQGEASTQHRPGIAETLGKSAIHDGHRRRVGAVARIEQPALLEREAKGRGKVVVDRA